MNTTYKTWTAGQQVRTQYGNKYTVLRQEGCMVLFTNGDWAHPNNLRAA